MNSIKIIKTNKDIDKIIKEIKNSNQKLMEELNAQKLLEKEQEAAKLEELIQNATKTSSGLAYKIITKGSGKEHPTAASNVTVHYTGKLLDGTVFDSSVERGQPVTFPLNRVIPGWTEGVQLMVVGDKWTFIIPGNLAYGERGVPQAGIGPNETLIFDVELLEIKDGASNNHDGHNH